MNNLYIGCISLLLLSFPWLAMRGGGGLSVVPTRALSSLMSRAGTCFCSPHKGSLPALLLLSISTKKGLPLFPPNLARATLRRGREGGGPPS